MKNLKRQLLNEIKEKVETIKILGEIENSDNLSDLFSVVSPKEIHLTISSGVVEMKENKVIILTD